MCPLSSTQREAQLDPMTRPWSHIGLDCGETLFPGPVMVMWRGVALVRMDMRGLDSA
jgi:hypothetical protein